MSHPRQIAGLTGRRRMDNTVRLDDDSLSTFRAGMLAIALCVVGFWGPLAVVVIWWLI